MSPLKEEPPKIPCEDARMNVVLWKKGRKKKPDPTLFINSVWNLVHRCHGDSQHPFEDAAKDVKDISSRMLMKLASAAEVVLSSEKIEKLLQERKISLDVVSDLAGIKNTERRDIVAETVAGMKLALDQRQVVSYAKRHPEAFYEQYKQRVLASKDVKEKIYMALLPFTEEEYERLKEESKKQKMSWDALCMKVIKDWLDEREK
jgi:hypothetical protein